MDVLIATLQGVAFEATTSGHAGQVKLFEHLCGLIRALSSFPPESITTYRTHIEKALKDLVLGEFGSKESSMTVPFLELIRDAFHLLYAQTDSRDMLGIAGEFQDTIMKKKSTPSTQAACLFALSGITRAKGKVLWGHLADTVLIAETTLTPRSKQALMKIASLAVSSVSSVTASSPALRIAAVDTLIDGLVGPENLVNRIGKQP